MAIAPAMRNEIHTAEPATSPAAPSNEKMPAPTMAPTPMNAACRTPREPPGAGAASVTAGASSKRRHQDGLDGVEPVLRLVEHDAGLRLEHLVGDLDALGHVGLPHDLGP